MTKLYLTMLLPLALAGCDSGPVREAKSAVEHGLLDGASARFRDVQQCEKERGIVYGEVNSKNSYGAYAGFERFYYIDGHVTMRESTQEYFDFLRRCFGGEVADAAIASFQKSADDMERELRATPSTAAPLPAH